MKKHFSGLIDSIINRPAMYGVNKVEDIQLIIFGYTACASQSPNDLNDFGEFRSFVNKHFDSMGDHDWARLIRFYSASDKHSIELFSELYHRYSSKVKATG